MRKLTAILLILLSVTALAYTAQSVYGQTGRIVVPDNYRTIQEAINHASAGDTVFVKAGTYKECVSINKSLALIGENKATTTILGDWQFYGTVVLVTHDEVSVSGFTIQSSCGYTAGTTRGVHLLNVQRCTVSGCIFSQIGKGIWLYNSSNNILEENSACGPRYYAWSGATLEYSSNNTIRNNTITSAEQGGIEVFSGSNGNNITGNYVQSKWTGINVASSDFNKIEDNIISGYRFGIQQDSSSHNTIKNNAILDSLTGIQANWASNYNFIENNNITHSNYCGIELHSNSSHNRVVANNIADNTHGLEIKSSTNNTVRYNNITGCSKIGAIFVDTSNNLIQKNNFIKNTQHISISESNSTWDTKGEGNYWDDYNGTDNDNNGVGDSQYVIDESNIDHYPLIKNSNPSALEIEILSQPSQTQGFSGSSEVLVAVASGTLVTMLVGIGLLLYFRKHRTQKTEP